MSLAPQPARPDWRGLALLLFAVIGWGSNWAPLKLVLAEVPPFTMRALGGFGGAVLLALMVAASGGALRLPLRLVGRVWLLGLLNISAWMGLVAFALLWLDASEAVVLAYSFPVWATLMAWPLLGERPTARRVLALLCGLGGVMLVMLGRGWAVGLEKLPGVLLCLGAAVSFALGTVLTKRRPLPLPGGAAVVWQLVLGTIPMVLAALLLERPDFAAVSTASYLWIGYMAVLPLCLSYLAWFAALRRLPAAVATQGSLVGPMVGVASSALLLGEPFGATQLVAFGLTLAGVVLAVRG
jgi:drug/metabolite transporter (DMT)-like permease